MKIAVPTETHAGESRVAASPDTVKAFIKKGAEVVVQAGAGKGASISDDAFAAAGAKIVPGGFGDADVVLTIRRPSDELLATLKRGTILMGGLEPYGDKAGLDAIAASGVTAFAMELMPRITRAQSMDILSSQSNLAGYKAVLDAAAEYGRAFPMMMTAAGTVSAAKVFVMGVGVAGLQAIATARRLGAQVSATDVRSATKEQIQSLGAKPRCSGQSHRECRSTQTESGTAGRSHPKAATQLRSDHQTIPIRGVRRSAPVLPSGREAQLVQHGRGVAHTTWQQHGETRPR